MGCACSDAPRHHDAALLRRLVLPGGATLRARLPARPTRDTLFCDVLRDQKTALKVTCGRAPRPATTCAPIGSGVLKGEPDLCLGSVVFCTVVG